MERDNETILDLESHSFLIDSMFTNTNTNIDSRSGGAGGEGNDSEFSSLRSQGEGEFYNSENDSEDYETNEIEF